MRYFSAQDGARLAFEMTESAGAPVAFLHPTPVDHRFWLPLLAELSGVTAILPDLRGHGASELGEVTELSMELLAQDTLLLLDHLDVRDAVFVGCSIGGYVLLEILRQQPEHVRAAAFVCSKPQADTDAGRAKRRASMAQVEANGPGAFLDFAATSLMGKSSLEREPLLASRARSLMTLSSAEILAVQAGLAARPQSNPATIQAPVLAIAASEDAACTPDEVRAFADAPNAEWHLLDGLGHFAAYEDPVRVAQTLLKWLTKLA